MIFEDNLRLSLLRYVTGGLAEDERALFEERLLTDQDFSDAAAVCEQELIDAYALKLLSTEETNSVRSWIESSTNRIRRVDMARALLVARPRTIRRKRYIAFVLTAACLLVIVGITLKLKNGPMPKNSAAVSSGKGADVSSLQSGTSQFVPGKTEKPEVILLVAERIRGQQKVSTYKIRPHAPVRVQIVLNGEKAKSGYSLKVVSVDLKQQIVLEQTGLKSRLIDGQCYIQTEFPPASLPPSTYDAVVRSGEDTFTARFTVKQ